MKLNLETKYNIFQEVEYKTINTSGIFVEGESREVIKKSRIITIDIQIGQYEDICVIYGMENDDFVCSDCIIGEN
ncbi:MULTISPECIES: hypothetical protein [unclassified Clostridioides]|uniref:hypothetical protein n=1 Tax=unclassified Clostridioides TaxID=2635829 RepID=UPI001D1295A9|nr:hypothetical protein [Clostridioides sp. ES-W-0018-02]MCC0713022.1 hypothetical protein [Clostridioides sp. ES-W-0017-02]